MTVLTGGVGGARFLRGLSPLIDPAALTVVANTADDEEFFGLFFNDTAATEIYTLAGRAHPVQGWGVAGDSFACLATLGGLGAPGWFRLGDRDLAVHVLRTAWLRQGLSLSGVTTRLAHAHGLRSRLLPMTTCSLRLPALCRSRPTWCVTGPDIACGGSRSPAPGGRVPPRVCWRRCNHPVT